MEIEREYPRACQDEIDRWIIDAIEAAAVMTSSHDKTQVKAADLSICQISNRVKERWLNQIVGESISDRVQRLRRDGALKPVLVDAVVTCWSINEVEVMKDMPKGALAEPDSESK